MNLPWIITFLVFHFLSAFLCLLLVMAIFRKIKSGQGLKSLLFAVYLVAFIVLGYHLNLFIIGVYIATVGSGNIEANDGSRVNSIYCVISALIDMYTSIGTMSGATGISIIMFATLSKNESLKRIFIYEKSKINLILSLLTFVIPMIFTVSYLIIGWNQSKTFYQVNIWYCSLNPNASPVFTTISSIVFIVLGLNIASLFGIAIRNLTTQRKWALEQMGKSNFPEDYFMRSFQIGFFASLIAILTGIDLLLNLYVSPSYGVMNSIPVYLMLQNAIIGCGVFQNWSTTEDLLPFVPFLSRQMKDVQEMMKRALQKEQNINSTAKQGETKTQASLWE